MKSYIKKLILKVLKVILRSRFEYEEKYHDLNFEGYDDKWINRFLKVFVNPTYLLKYLRYYFRVIPRLEKNKFQDERWKKALNDLTAHGIAEIPALAPELAEYLEKDYFKLLEQNIEESAQSKYIRLDNKRNIYHRYMHSKNDKLALNLKAGVVINKLISFTDPNVSNFLLNQDLHKLIHAYYKKQHYIRNHPTLVKSDWKKDFPMPQNGNFHFDHFHQLSLMLLVNDLSKDDTHMEYAKGSHKYTRTSISKNGHFYSRKYVYEHYKIAHAIGPKGTLYIFDTAGLHSGKYQESNNARKMLHLNITTGHSIEPNKFNRKEEWPELQKIDQNFIKKSFDKILNS